MKKSIKMTKSKKIVIAVSAVIVAAAAGLSVYFALKPDESSAVQVVKVTTGDITETLDLSGTVNSENQGTFEILDGTYVKKVNVRIGDQVKKGDVLATFDTSSVSDIIEEKQSTYTEALDAYNDYVSTTDGASDQLYKITEKICDLEDKIDKLNEQVKKSDKKAPETEEVKDLKDKFSEILGDSSIASELIDRIISSSSDFSKTIELLQGISSGISNQISGIVSLMSVSDEEKQLVSSQLELVELKVKQGILKLQSNAALETLYLSVVESAKKDLRDTQEAVENLKKGWIAENDGIIREINIKEGEYYKAQEKEATSIQDIDISSVLSSVSDDSTDFSAIIKQLFPGKPSGMVVEYYPLSATFTVSKNDIFKIALEQSVKITSASGEVFDGHISYISPVATDSGISISSILGTDTSSGGIEGKVIIEKPNKSIIIGLDVDLSIKLESAENTLLVPVESIQYSDEGAYVFVYDKKEKRVKKTLVETGLFDGTHYQIVSGCSKGDIIVKAPSQDMKDGQKIYVKN